MSEDLQLVLWACGIGVVVGLPLGLFIRRRFKQASKRYGSWCNSLPWWAYGSFGLVFTAMMIANLNRTPFVVFFASFAALEFAVMGLQIAKRPNRAVAQGH